jgi:hypothetical protein
LRKADSRIAASLPANHDACVDVREELGQLVVEQQVHADDGGDRRLAHLLLVAGVHAGDQRFLLLGAAHEDEAARAAVGGRRAPT